MNSGIQSEGSLIFVLIAPTFLMLQACPYCCSEGGGDCELGPRGSNCGMYVCTYRYCAILYPDLSPLTQDD